MEILQRFSRKCETYVGRAGDIIIILCRLLRRERFNLSIAGTVLFSVDLASSVRSIVGFALSIRSDTTLAGTVRFDIGLTGKCEILSVSGT